MLDFVRDILLRLLLRKEINTMAIVYATLIIRDAYSFADVPAKIKEKVKQTLIDLDCGELAE